jgi:hypothetical protein
MVALVFRKVSETIPVLGRPLATLLYCSETWRGKPLNTDNDNFITRYIDRKGWRISLRTDEAAVVYISISSSVSDGRGIALHLFFVPPNQLNRLLDMLPNTLLHLLLNVLLL